MIAVFAGSMLQQAGERFDVSFFGGPIKRRSSAGMNVCPGFNQISAISASPRCWH